MVGSQVFPRTPGIAAQLLKATAVAREMTNQDDVRTVTNMYDKALNVELTAKPGRCAPTPHLCCSGRV